MRKVFLTLVVALFCQFVFSQGGKIKFEITTYDYGTLREEVGEATAKFVFTNVGTGDLQVTHVQPSCGCTAADYTKTVVKPGEKGYVSAVYHTSGRPGPFQKSLTVTVNDIESPTVGLTIKGTVTPKAKSKGDYYPMAIGNLKLMSNHLAFNDMKSNQIKTDSMKIYNQWEGEMTISFKDVPAHITVTAVPEKLAKDQEGVIIVTYDATKKADFGLVYDRIDIVTNDAAGPNKSLNVSANIIEDFSTLTEKQIEKAPHIDFKETTFNFGNVKSGTVVKYDFEFTNSGKSKLVIRKIKPECGCTTYELAKTIFKKNKKGKISVVFDTSSRHGDENKMITVITNDPKKPVIQLYLKGTIE